MTPQQEKALAIARATIDAAYAIARHKKLAYPGKKLFASNKYLRAPIKRRTKVIARANMIMSAVIGGAQIRRIISRPIPRFPSGSAFVHATGPEIIFIGDKPVIVK